jgi:hypothetical protein
MRSKGAQIKIMFCRFHCVICTNCVKWRHNMGAVSVFLPADSYSGLLKGVCFTFLYSRVRASWIYVNDFPTRCNYTYTVYLYLQTALHVSGGISTHHQELILVWKPTTLTTGCSNGHTNTRCCRYSDMSSWWWVEIPPETCTAVYRYK